MTTNRTVGVKALLLAVSFFAGGSVPATLHFVDKENVGGNYEGVGQGPAVFLTLPVEGEESAAGGAATSSSSSAPYASYPPLHRDAVDAGFTSWEALFANPQDARRIAKTAITPDRETFEALNAIWSTLVTRADDSTPQDLLDYGVFLHGHGVRLENEFFWLRKQEERLALVASMHNTPSAALPFFPAAQEYEEHRLLTGARAMIMHYLREGGKPEEDVQETCVHILSHSFLVDAKDQESADKEKAALMRAIALFLEQEDDPSSLPAETLLILARLYLQSYTCVPDDLVDAQDMEDAQKGAVYLKHFLARKTLPNAAEFDAFDRVIRRLVQSKNPKDFYLKDVEKLMKRVLDKSTYLNDRSVVSFYLNAVLPQVEGHLTKEKRLSRFAAVGGLLGSSMSPYALPLMPTMPKGIASVQFEYLRRTEAAQAFEKALALAQTAPQRAAFSRLKADQLYALARLRVSPTFLSIASMDHPSAQDTRVRSALASLDAARLAQHYTTRQVLFERALSELESAMGAGYTPQTAEEIASCAGMYLDNALEKAGCLGGDTTPEGQLALARDAVLAWERYDGLCAPLKEAPSFTLTPDQYAQGALAHSLVGQNADMPGAMRLAYLSRAAHMWDEAFKAGARTWQEHYMAATIHHWLGTHLMGEEGRTHWRQAARVWDLCPSSPMKLEEKAPPIAQMLADAAKVSSDQSKALSYVMMSLMHSGWSQTGMSAPPLTDDQVRTIARRLEFAWDLAATPSQRADIAIRTMWLVTFLSGKSCLKGTSAEDTIRHIQVTARQMSQR